MTNVTSVVTNGTSKVPAAKTPVVKPVSSPPAKTSAVKPVQTPPAKTPSTKPVPPPPTKTSAAKPVSPPAKTPPPSVVTLPTNYNKIGETFTISPSTAYAWHIEL